MAFPGYTKPFQIFTDAYGLLLGGIVSQDGRPIDFYSRKLQPYQTRYLILELELLLIVEVLKDFRSILLGLEKTVYSHHKNLSMD